MSTTPVKTDDPLGAYKNAELPVPDRYRRWHLYGAGLDNVGRNGAPEVVPLPEPGPDEILVRHDACGICFSDIKIINLGGEHPRLQGRDLTKDPVVMGHEVALTVVKAGDNVKAQFTPGQRYIVQADVYYRGVNLAYGYALTGGMSQYGLIGPEVLQGDEGCYLLPIQEDTGYAEAALVEPWACVEAAYHWHHREDVEPGNKVLIIGKSKYELLSRMENLANQGWLTVADEDKLRSLVSHDSRFDDIIFVDNPNPEVFEQACAHLNKDGIACLLFNQPLSRPVQVDVGRIHYDGHRYVGRLVGKGMQGKPQDAYTLNTRSEIKPGGKAWFIGAAGPMGQMHVQRAMQLPNPPAHIVGTDVDAARLESLRSRFAKLAQERGIRFDVFNPADEGAPKLEEVAPDGFDDIVLMVPSPALIEQTFPYLAQNGVYNIFAGVARGTMATLDMSDIVTKNVRIVGTSGSSIEDMRLTRDTMEKDALDTGASLAAIGGLNAFREGLEAVKTGRFPGKTVIFPQIEDLPLTPLPELKNVRPKVYEKLKDGQFWTNEAEEELLREALEEGKEGE